MILPHKAAAGPEEPSMADEAELVEGLVSAAVRRHGQCRPFNLLVHDSVCTLYHVWCLAVSASPRRLYAP